jgi:hypothetical protein
MRTTVTMDEDVEAKLRHVLDRMDHSPGLSQGL